MKPWLYKEHREDHLVGGVCRSSWKTNGKDGGKGNGGKRWVLVIFNRGKNG